LPTVTTTIRALTLAALCGLSSGGSAQQADSLLKRTMKTFDFATDVGPPVDFVVQSRPKGDLDYIPVFQKTPEPALPALKDKELKALKGDLDSVQKSHDAVRAAFPPSAKALADAKAAEQKKAKSKTPDDHF
jgi:hypothetical protein